MNIDEILLQKGTKGKGWLPVCDGLGWWEASLPLMWVTGMAPGPVLVVTAAVHGDEYEGGEAVRRLWSQLEPDVVRGALVAVPAVNLPAHRVGHRLSPLDHQDMNRIFPGRPCGSLSEVIAYVVFHEVICKGDYFVDLHAGGLGFAILPMATFLEEGSEESVWRERAFARNTGLSYLWKGSGKWSSAHVAAVRHGIPGVLLELGQEGRCSETSVARAIDCLTNVMRHTGLIAGSVTLPDRVTVVRGTYSTASVGGLFLPCCTIGDGVRAGQAVGRIVDVFGEELETVRAPYDGVVCSIRTFPSVQPGEWTVFVGELVAEDGL